MWLRSKFSHGTQSFQFRLGYFHIYHNSCRLDVSAEWKLVERVSRWKPVLDTCSCRGVAWVEHLASKLTDVALDSLNILSEACHSKFLSDQPPTTPSPTAPGSHSASAPASIHAWQQLLHKKPPFKSSFWLCMFKNLLTEPVAISAASSRQCIDCI